MGLPPIENGTTTRQILSTEEKMSLPLTMRMRVL